MGARPDHLSHRFTTHSGSANLHKDLTQHLPCLRTMMLLDVFPEYVAFINIAKEDQMGVDRGQSSFRALFRSHQHRHGADPTHARSNYDKTSAPLRSQRGEELWEGWPVMS